MRILFLHPNFPAQFRHLAQALAANPDHQVWLGTQPNRPGGEIPGVQTVLFAPSRPPSAQTHHYVQGLEAAVLQGQAVYRMADQLQQQGFVPDLVYGEAGSGVNLFIKDIFPDAKVLCTCEWYYHAVNSELNFDPNDPPDVDDQLRTRIRNASILLDLQNCDWGVTPTHWQRSRFPREYQTKISVLPHGVDTDYFQPDPTAKLGLPNLDLASVNELVTYVARGLEPYRGFPQFMAALPKLLEQRPQCHVVIVGSPQVYYGNPLANGKSYPEDLLEKLSLDLSRVHFTGILPYNQYRQVLQASSVHVHLTRPFIPSRSLLEALSTGCLVIGSQTAPVQEVIQDAQNGFLVDFFDTQQLIDRLCDVLAHPSEMQAIRAKARQTVLEKYRLADWLPQHLQLLERVVQGSQPSTLEQAATSPSTLLTSSTSEGAEPREMSDPPVSAAANNTWAQFYALQKPATEPMCVDLGCGIHKPKGFIGVDLSAAAGVDIVADLSQTFPFPDNTVDYLRAHDIVEHLPDRIHTMNEIWRICKPGAWVDIRVPSTDGRGAFQDPTHISFWNINSFQYYAQEFPAYLELCKTYGFQGEFRIISLVHEPKTLDEVIHVRAKLEVVKSSGQAALEPVLLSFGELRSQRRQLAEIWLSLPASQLEAAFKPPLSQQLTALRNTNLRYLPLEASEQTFVHTLEQKLSDPSQALQAFLALIPYRFAHQLPVGAWGRVPIPTWLFSVILEYLLERISFFTEVGEADRYTELKLIFLRQWCTQLASDPLAPMWQTVAKRFTEFSSFVPCYFTRANLKELYVKRSELIEAFLQAAETVVNYNFPPRPSRDRIRLGILNNHFLPSPETYVTLPVFEFLDVTRFEVILYGFKNSEHPLEVYCRGRADEFVVLPPNDTNKAAARIRSDDLDILWIGTNVTAVAHQVALLAHCRLARVQVASGTSPVTTGIRNIDYHILGTLHATTGNPQDHYSETVALVEGPTFCFSYNAVPITPTVTQVTRQTWGVTSEMPVFISGANFFKLIPELLHVWAMLLSQVPNSILVLYPFNRNWSSEYPRAEFQVRLQRILKYYGVTADRVLLLEALANREDVKAWLRLADVYLDSFPYTGATTIVDALEANLPIVTLTGETLREDLSAGMLRACQLDHCIVKSIDAYLERAQLLANDPALREQERQLIQDRMANNPNCLNSRQFGQRVGNLLESLFEQWLTTHSATATDVAE